MCRHWYAAPNSSHSIQRNIFIKFQTSFFQKLRPKKSSWIFRQKSRPFPSGCLFSNREHCRPPLFRRPAILSKCLFNALHQPYFLLNLFFAYSLAIRSASRISERLFPSPVGFSSSTAPQTVSPISKNGISP